MEWFTDSLHFFLQKKKNILLLRRIDGTLFFVTFFLIEGVEKCFLDHDSSESIHASAQVRVTRLHKGEKKKNKKEKGGIKISFESK